MTHNGGGYVQCDDRSIAHQPLLCAVAICAKLDKYFLMIDLIPQIGAVIKKWTQLVR